MCQSIKTFSSIVSLFFGTSVLAQPQETLIKHDFIDKAFKLMQVEESYPHPGQSLQSVIDTPCQSKNIDLLLSQMKQQAKADVDLLEIDLESGIRISNNENSSAYVGLAFHLLGKGFYENKLKQKVMAAESELLQLKAIDKQKKNQALCQQANLSKTFAQLRVQAINKIISYNSDYIQTLKKAYFTKQIFIDEIIKEEKRLQKLSLIKEMNERQLATVGVQQQVIHPQALFPLFDLDINVILNQHFASQQLVKRKKLHKALLSKERDSLTQQKLKVYARYGNTANLAEDDSFNDFDDDWTLGLRYTLPLFSGKQHFKNYQIDKKALGFELSLVDNEKQIRGLYAEHQNKLTDAINIKFDISLSRERLRRALFDYQEHKDLARQNVLNKQLLEYLYSKLALINSTELLYRNFINLVLYSNAPYNNKQLVTINVHSPLEHRARLGKRSILIDDSGIFAKNVNEVTKLLLTKKIDTAIFNINFIKQPEYVQLVRELNRYHIKHTIAIDTSTFNQQVKALNQLFNVQESISITIGPIENINDIENMLKQLFFSESVESLSRLSLQFVLTNPVMEVINIGPAQLIVLLEDFTKISQLKKEPLLFVDLSKVNTEQSLEEKINNQLHNKSDTHVFLKNLKQLITLFSFTGTQQ